MVDHPTSNPYDRDQPSELLVDPATGIEYDDLREAIEEQFRQPDSEAPVQRAKDKTVPGIGHFIKPKQNIWAAHYALVKDPANQIDYSPAHYPYFDRVVSQYYHQDAFDDPEHRAYEKYRAMRDNIAAMRNFLLACYFPDGSGKKNDFQKSKELTQIAYALGDGLQNDKRWLMNPFTASIDRDRANIPGYGAQYMYRAMRQKQFVHNLLWPIMVPITAFRSGYTGKKQEYHWLNLPPLSKTPFSDKALKAIPANGNGHADDSISPADTPNLKDNTRTINDAVDSTTIGTAATSLPLLQDVESLEEGVKERSVAIAREILEKLRISIGNIAILDGLKVLPSDGESVLQRINEVLDIFEHYLAQARAFDPSILQDRAVMIASQAAGKLTYQGLRLSRQHAREQGDEATAKMLEGHMNRLPKEWAAPQEKQFTQLLDQLELGLHRVEQRVENIGTRETFGQGSRGLADGIAIGAHADTNQKKREKRNLSMEYDEQYKAMLQARRAQREAIRLHLSSQSGFRSQQDRTRELHSQQRRESSSSQSLDTMLTPRQLSEMRQALGGITPGASMVEPGSVKSAIKAHKEAQIQRQLIEGKVAREKRSGLSVVERKQDQIVENDPPRPDPSLKRKQPEHHR